MFHLREIFGRAVQLPVVAKAAHCKASFRRFNNCAFIRVARFTGATSIYSHAMVELQSKAVATIDANIQTARDACRHA